MFPFLADFPIQSPKKIGDFPRPFFWGSARRSHRRSARRSAYRIMFNDVSLVDPQQSLQAQGIKDLAKVRFSGDVLGAIRSFLDSEGLKSRVIDIHIYIYIHIKAKIRVQQIKSGMSLEIICVAFFWHEQDTAWLVCNPKPMVLYPELSVTSLQSHLEYLSKNWWPCNFDVLSNTWFWSISIAATRCIDLGGAPRSTLWRTGTLRNANGTKRCIWIYMCQATPCKIRHNKIILLKYWQHMMATCFFVLRVKSSVHIVCIYIIIYIYIYVFIHIYICWF